MSSDESTISGKLDAVVGPGSGRAAEASGFAPAVSVESPGGPAAGRGAKLKTAGVVFSGCLQCA